jgi:membrane protein implicated in regulation of membrane protease activity
MSWELFFLVCFVVGFSFSVLSFLGGLGRFHLHVPKHLHFGGAGHGMAHAGGAHSLVHGPHASGHAVEAGDGHGASFPVFNPVTLAAFLTWFGGVGYLLVHLRHVWIFAGLLFASAAGLAAASLVFFFVAKVVLAKEKELDPLDYEMVGVLGHVSSSIRRGGTGEMIYMQEGVRRPCAARSETGDPLVKGEEVVVTRYERGVAYVRRWEDLNEPAAFSPEEEKKSN